MRGCEEEKSTDKDKRSTSEDSAQEHTPASQKAAGEGAADREPNSVESKERAPDTAQKEAAEEDAQGGVGAKQVTPTRPKALGIPEHGQEEWRRDRAEPSSPSWVVNGVLASLSSVASAVVRSVRELMDIAKDTNLDGSRKNAHLPILMLGVRYEVGQAAANDAAAGKGGDAAQQDVAQSAVYQFKLHLFSCLWFTYRSGMAPIGQSGLTSDAGWGCMHRAGQMLLAQALLQHRLGREWRLPPNAMYGELPAEYREVLELFGDAPACPLSVHNMTKAGEKVGKRAGQWFSPGAVCKALSLLHEGGGYGERWGVSVLLYDSSDGDNTVYKAPARRLLQTGAVVLLLPVRLGMHTIDESYLPKVGPILGLAQSIGFVGGHPNSAHYFVASQGSQIYYLDPHTSRPVVNLTHPSAAAAAASQPLHRSWHCTHTASMALHDVDGSVAFGFYCRTEAELEELCVGLDSLAKAAGGYPAVSVAEEKAAMREWDGADEESGDDEWVV